MEKLIKILAESFGQEKIRINSEYHIQVSTDKGYCDIWRNKYNEFKIKFPKLKNTQELYFNQILPRIKSFTKSDKKTDIDKMKKALSIAELIVKMDHIGGKAVFVDAGFKNKKAKIAAIFVNEDQIDAKVREIEVETVTEAEKEAILLGLSMCDDVNVNVFTDNESVSKYFHRIGKFQVMWQSRKHNKAADSISNMRTKNDNKAS